jgi:hypothetical protein
MAVLAPELRSVLSRAVLDARTASENAAGVALTVLGVDDDKVTSGMDDTARGLRRSLRARMRLLGGYAELVAEVAYEQWHAMLFARFLAENDLLIHPDAGVSVSLRECGELAPELGEPDEWMVATRFASAMLPAIFRPDDPSFQVRYAQEGRVRLERILSGLPSAVFTADDSLGWVYQYWQTEAKKSVNASETRVGGADVAPVTQLFTESYMVQFLLHNSLGAWWAWRHPESPLVETFEFLRLRDKSVGEHFDAWPDRVAELTVMDPCCGSGHFLVEAFAILVAMRVEEEGEDLVTAGDRVLRDNLFGLELDPRCAQIGTFALALAAWKMGGYRVLPQPNVACTGIRVVDQWPEWKKLAVDDAKLEIGLRQLFDLFQRAPDLGSLIDPVRELEREGELLAVPFDEVAPLLDRALAAEPSHTETHVSAIAAAGTAQAARFLARQYTLVATNVPYLGRGRQDDTLRDFCDGALSAGRADLAASFTLRIANFLRPGGLAAIVIPETIRHLTSFDNFRRRMLSETTFDFLAILGAGAFSGISGEVVKPMLLGFYKERPDAEAIFLGLDVSRSASNEERVRLLRDQALRFPSQAAQLQRPHHRITLIEGATPAELLSDVARSVEGTSTGDAARYLRYFWELPEIAPDWELFQRAPDGAGQQSGCSEVVMWQQGKGPLANDSGARIQGLDVHGKPGVLVGRMGSIVAAPYQGGFFDKSCVVLVPKSPELLPPILAYATSVEYEEQIRAIDTKIGAATSVMVEVPFDRQRWSAVSDNSIVGCADPTQWLFEGQIQGSSHPLQVAVTRLLGYRWPKQRADELDALTAADGLVSVPAIAGEFGAGERLRGILERAFGGEFSPALLDGLLSGAGAPGRSLSEWLRDKFFEQHFDLFQKRPFIWHIWDGRKDGFSALVNYHRLDRRLLEKLTYAVLGSWIEAQQAQVNSGTTGADLRLAAAKDLQARLELILVGEKPYDLYVRWKPVRLQPIGWEPDLDDGIRLNIRPFIEADVLRMSGSKIRSAIKWGTDRGKDQDGNDRDNNRHLTLAEKDGERGR